MSLKLVDKEINPSKAVSFYFFQEYSLKLQHFYDFEGTTNEQNYQIR